MFSELINYILFFFLFHLFPFGYSWSKLVSIFSSFCLFICLSLPIQAGCALVDGQSVANQRIKYLMYLIDIDKKAKMLIRSLLHYFLQWNVWLAKYESVFEKISCQSISEINFSSWMSDCLKMKSRFSWKIKNLNGIWVHETLV